jgi:glycosyltransferase domain-containing protein
MNRERTHNPAPLCTILVPLKDNMHRTKHFLRNNYFTEFQYLFADGSFGHENEMLIKSHKSQNFTYVRCPADASLELYLQKIKKASEIVTTPFVMTMDAGDYLSPAGVDAATTRLIADTTAASAGGDLFFMREIGPFITKPFLANSASHLSNRSIEEALMQIRGEYSQLWYAIQRIEVFRATWSIMASEKFKHPYMEYFPTVSALGHGTYIDTTVPTLLRVVHGPRSWTKQSSDFHLDRHIDNVAVSTAEFADRCSELFDVSSDVIFQAFERNATAIFQAMNRQTLGPSWFQRIMPSENAVKKFPILFNVERAIGHYAGLIFPGSLHGRYFSIFRWSRKRSQIKKFRKKSAVIPLT